ncbi:hypothetical protein QC762_0062120 [Podospora pseudocomata]|uniref:Uncharacterized protein n=1 Tax=Podospora pseudocomata TaxID=2093779 RepID=A0ABR0GEF2_9PEZI|nr:hypothetical protein QC762_0062120 [Podospora pseudocomata]
MGWTTAFTGFVSCQSPASIVAGISYHGYPPPLCPASGGVITGTWTWLVRILGTDPKSSDSKLCVELHQIYLPLPLPIHPRRSLPVHNPMNICIAHQPSTLLPLCCPSQNQRHQTPQHNPNLIPHICFPRPRPKMALFCSEKHPPLIGTPEVLLGMHHHMRLCLVIHDRAVRQDEHQSLSHLLRHQDLTSETKHLDIPSVGSAEHYLPSLELISYLKDLVRQKRAG